MTTRQMAAPTLNSTWIDLNQTQTEQIASFTTTNSDINQQLPAAATNAHGRLTTLDVG